MDADTMETAFLTSPQLSTHSTQCTFVDVIACKLYVLLMNGHIHVWKLALSQPPQLEMVWTKMEREKLTHFALLVGHAVTDSGADSMGLVRQSSSVLI